MNHCTKHLCQAAILLSSLVLLSGCTSPSSPPGDKGQINQTPPPQQLPHQDEATNQLREKGPAAPSSTLGQAGRKALAANTSQISAEMAIMPSPIAPEIQGGGQRPTFDQESYAPSTENAFINAQNDPLSTFSIDVDTASYSNIRRFITSGSLPGSGAVRIEEMINYFSYDYQEPTKDPFAITTELGPCPWQSDHQLVRIGLKSKDLPPGQLPPSNLVFLIDVSGSMEAANKLPLLKRAMLMLVEQMGADDRIAIVVYAGEDRVVLPPTPASRRPEIIAAIDALSSGGATHAASGIVTAYQLAEQSFMPKGNNRVILASDGDFNVGVTSRDQLKELIETKRTSGVYLTVLGFGMGNYHDDSMEILADAGNGNYAYIDSLLEAKKVLIKERGSNLFALAKDVKIQVEFNPAKVGAYRLLGYENRLLADEDFKDDKKDAGEVGPGQRVTALYEIIPSGAAGIPPVDERKYGRPTVQGEMPAELMTIKIRYKPLNQTTSVSQSLAVPASSSDLAATSDDFRFVAAVAGFGMLLKNSTNKGKASYPMMITLAQNAKGQDRDGYRAEFIRLLELAEMLAKK